MIKNTIIVIDSGVDIKNKEINKVIIGGKSIKKIKNNYIVDTNIQDDNGHGTQCISVIKSINKNVRIYVLKIIRENGKCSSDLLYRALQVCLNIPIPIISISLSIINDMCDKNKIEKIFLELKKRERICFISVQNKKKESFPSNLNSVIGICGDNRFYNSEFIYNPQSILPNIFSGGLQYTYGMNSELKLFCGNSKACAVAAGIFSLLENKEKMYLKSMKKLCDYNLIKKNLSINEKKIVKALRKLNGENLCSKNIYFSIFNPFSNLTIDNCLNFIRMVENYFNIRFEIEDLQLINIYYYNNLAILINKKVNRCKND